ncbi:unnamed protein product [Trichobilharzia regenti]|nr:unnamed protein product [Trichobilharzia regenti]
MQIPLGVNTRVLALCSASIFYPNGKGGIPHPPTHRLTLEEVFDSKGEPRIKELKQHFILEGRVTEQVALKIIRAGAALLRDENTVLDIDAPVTGELLSDETRHPSIICVKFSIFY